MTKGVSLVEKLKGGLEAALKDSLKEGEPTLVCLEGSVGEALVATDTRVIVLKAGYSSGAMLGRKAKSFPYRHITSIELSAGLMSGRVEVTVAGSVERQHGYRQRSLLDAAADARQAENVVNFPTAKKATFQAAVHLIREKIEETQAAPTPAATTAGPVVDVAEQIRKLGELVNDGLITRDEFEAKKKELLAKL